MLFVLSPLRDLAIKQRNIPEAEKVLSSMARKFAEVMKLESCILIFDDTLFKVDEPHFRVCSARPTYPTSDDALVDFAKNQKGVFVTADRELIARLKECDCNTFRPKEWFHLVAKCTEHKAEVNDLDNWANQWIEKITFDMQKNLTL